MNPNETIRKWLLACGKQFGIRQAHDYRWSDADSRQHEMYFTYRIIESRPMQVGIEDASTLTSNTVNHKALQRWLTDVEIKLYNSQDGMFELASCFVGAQSIPSIRRLFGGYHSPPRNPVTTDESIIYDDDIDYIHKMIVQFEEEIEFIIDETNGSVDQIDLTIESGAPTYEIDRNGITVT